MPRVCQITGKKTQVGRMIARRGLPKRKGGVGLKTTGITGRQYRPNLQYKRIWVPELKKFVRVRICRKALKDLDRKGPYRLLIQAGLIKPVEHKKKSEAPKSEAKK